MAVMAGVLNETQRRTLEALCDTIVPSVEYDGDDEAMKAFMARSAGDMAIAAQIEGLMAQAMLPDDIAGFAALLDALAQHDFASLPLELRTVASSRRSRPRGPEAKLGVKVLQEPHAALLLRAARRAGPQPELGGDRLPRARSPRRPARSRRRRRSPSRRSSGAEATLTADVCVVGSGAGGGVIAAELQKAGKSVLVLEQGGYRNEQDFKQLELPGSLELLPGRRPHRVGGRLDLGARRARRSAAARSSTT